MNDPSPAPSPPSGTTSTGPTGVPHTDSTAPGNVGAPHRAGRGGPSGWGIVIGLAVGLVVALGVSAVVRAGGGGGEMTAGGFYGTVLDDPRDRPEFVLTDTSGEPFDFAARTEGRLTILFFGYANCPDICPITLATLDGALGAVERMNADVVFVSVDPDRDTPAELRAYLDRFDPAFVGLTGTPEELAAAQRAAGVTEAVDEGPNDRGGYDVGHSSQVIVYTPDDRAHLVYGFGVRQDEWASDLRRLRDDQPWW